MIASDQNLNLKQVYPLIDFPVTYSSLVSAVYRQDNYWIYNSETLYSDIGKLREDYDHSKMAWQIISLQNQKCKKLTLANEI